MTTPDQVAELRRLLANASPGPWEDDSMPCEGGYDARQMCGPEGKVIFDSLNSEAAVVHEEYGDEEFGGGAWDETAKRDFAAVAALRNAAPGLLDDIDALRRENAELREALLMCAAHCQGGHSEAGMAAAKALGLKFPVTMVELKTVAAAAGYDPVRLWPWMYAPRAGRFVAKPAPETGEDACG